jgi:hypothetical protein
MPSEAVSFPASGTAAADDWLAGILEGEGWFSLVGRRYPRIGLDMTDLDTVRRAAALFGGSSIGIVDDPRGALRAWRRRYTTAITGAAAARLMERLRPRMGLRRRAAIDHALAAYVPERLVGLVGCSVAGCTKPHRSRGLCHAHYMTWSRDRAKGRTPRVTPLR